jgi:hypothetical protein
MSGTTAVAAACGLVNHILNDRVVPMTAEWKGLTEHKNNFQEENIIVTT